MGERSNNEVRRPDFDLYDAIERSVGRVRETGQTRWIAHVIEAYR